MSVRRAGAPGIRRGIRSVRGGAAGGAAAPAWINLDDGDFSRSGSADYFDGVGSMDSAGTNVLRKDDRDGNGALALLTWGDTNFCTRSHEVDQWTTNAGTPVITTGQADPKGGTQADQVEDNESGATAALNIPDASRFSIGFFIKKDNNESRFPEVEINASNAFQINTKTGAIAWRVGSATTIEAISRGDWWEVYARNIVSSSGWIFKPAAASTLGGAIDATVTGSCVVWGFFRGFTFFDHIETNGSSVTKATDVLTFDNGSYPDELRTVGFKMSFRPIHSSTTIDRQGCVIAVDSGASDLQRIQLELSGGLHFVLKNAAVEKLTSKGITWGADDEITMTVDFSANEWKVLGLSSGDETIDITGIGNWNGGLPKRLHVGMDRSNINHIAARFENIEEFP